jgi:hypothetical protein
VEHFAGHVFSLGVDPQPEVGIAVDRVDVAVVKRRERAAVARRRLK